MERWRGRTALVTGASSGIGAAIARRLAHEGMQVALCARRAEPLEETRQACEAAGARTLARVTDLRREDEILALFQQVRQAWGGVDVLVNNAGLGRAASILDGDTADWREMLEVNVLALLVCTREATGDMRRRNVDGHVLHISSMSGYRVTRRGAVYAATKHAVRALTTGLRQELVHSGTGIRITAISPGLVETGFAQVFERRAEAAAETYGSYTVLEAPDIAEAAVYALSQPPHVQIHDILLRSVEQPI